MLLRAALLICGATLARTSLVRLEHTSFEGQWALDEPVYSVDDAPEGKADAYVHLEVTLKRSSKVAGGRVEALVFDGVSKPFIGIQPEGGGPTLLCCDSLAQKRGHCGVAQLDEVVRGEQYTGAGGVHVTARWAGDSLSLKLNPPKWNVTRRGLYTVLLAVCDQRAVGVVTMDGLLEFKSPYGYVPGHLYGYLPFWSGLVIAYALAALLWFVLMSLHWRDILTLQMCITGLLFCGMIEALFYDFIFASFNESGVAPSISLSICAAIINTLKRTLSRMLVLVVSMGFGVMKPTLGSKAPRVVVAGLVYFVCGSALEVINWLGHSSELGVGLRLVFVLPVAALDSLFAVWTFASLSQTVSQLQQRRQTRKLRLYAKFSQIMAGMIAVSVLWSTYEVYVASPNGELFNERWDAYWALEAFWPALYFAVLLVIMTLWAPSKNAMRYAYSDEVAVAQHDEYSDDDAYLDEDEVGGMSLSQIAGADDVVERTPGGKKNASATRDSQRRAEETGRRAAMVEAAHDEIAPKFLLADEDEEEQEAMAKLN